MQRPITAFAVAFALVFCPTALAGGAHRWGQYLNGELVTQTSSAAVGLSEVTAVDASNSSSYFLRADGTVWAEGNGEEGQLGDGSLSSSPATPVKVALPEDTVAVSLGEAKNEGAAVDDSGHVWVWGANGSSSLCVRGRKLATPVRVPGVSTAAEIQGGQEHMLIRLADGTLLGCGTNAEGQLGLDQAIAIAKKPTAVPGLSNIVQINSGNRDTAARDGAGHVFMFGNNVFGQIGNGESTLAVYTPTLVPLPGPASQVSVGGDLTHANGSNGAVLALVEGTMYGWGNDASAQVGDGVRKRSQPSPVNTGLHFNSVAAGGAFGLGMDSEGNLFSWGSNGGGALGVGKMGGTFLKPQFVEAGVTAISATARNVENVG